jgi:hypothetical protein
MLRGPQTPGELRSRADRLYTFDDIAAVNSTLERLASRPQPDDNAETPDATGPLVVILPRQPGSRESRYMHLLGGPNVLPNQPPQPLPNLSANTEGLLANLQEELIVMRSTIIELEKRIAHLESLYPDDTLPPAQFVG